MIARALVSIANLYSILIFVYVLMSWFPMRGTLYDAYRVLGTLIEPYVGLFRRIIPPIGGFDFSPWAAILVLRWVAVPLIYLILGGR